MNPLGRGRRRSRRAWTRTWDFLVDDDTTARRPPAVRPRRRRALDVRRLPPRHRPRPRAPPEEVEDDDDDPEHEQDHADGGDVDSTHVRVHGPREDRAKGDEDQSDDNAHRNGRSRAWRAKT